MAGKSWRTSGHQFFVGFFFALPEGINSKTCKNMTSYRKMSGWKCDKCAPVLHSYTLFLRLKKGQGEIFESRSLIMSRQKSLSQLQPKLSGTFLDIRDGPWYSQMYGLFLKKEPTIHQGFSQNSLADMGLSAKRRIAMDQDTHDAAHVSVAHVVLVRGWLDVKSAGWNGLTTQYDMTTGNYSMQVWSEFSCGWGPILQEWLKLII